VDRIAIVGCIGAGKSTLARQLGAALGLEVIHLDRLWWEDGSYVIRGRKTVRERTLAPPAYRRVHEEVVAADRWVIDGDAAWLDLRLGRADTIVFMDLPGWLCAGRVIRRAGKPRADYPPNVRESWRWTLVLLKWIVWTYPRSRSPAIAAGVAANSGHARVIRLARRSEVSAFLASVAA
jgi:adenylate kinase family enzyme